MKRQQHFILSDTEIEWIRAEAARRECSMSQVLRDLIAAEKERREKRGR